MTCEALGWALILLVERGPLPFFLAAAFLLSFFLILSHQASLGVRDWCLPGLGDLEVLLPDVDSLFLILFPDLFLDNHADRSRIDVEDSAGAPVVGLVRHAFLLGPINLDVHVLADLEGRQVFRHANGALVAEGLLERLSRLRSVTE
jgi:hypothetical protein